VKKFESFFIAGLIILIFFCGYYVGLNETESGKHVLKKSQWEEIHAYRVCMYNPLCKMYIAVNNEK